MQKGEWSGLAAVNWLPQQGVIGSSWPGQFVSGRCSKPEKCQSSSSFSLSWDSSWTVSSTSSSLSPAQLIPCAQKNRVPEDPTEQLLLVWPPGRDSCCYFHRLLPTLVKGGWTKKQVGWCPGNFDFDLPPMIDSQQYLRQMARHTARNSDPLPRPWPGNQNQCDAIQTKTLSTTPSETPDYTGV